MPRDYPYEVIDAFLLDAAGRVFKASGTNLEANQYEGAEITYSVPFDEVVRIAMTGKYDFVTFLRTDDGPPEFVREASWAIPRDRALQFASLLRYMASGEHDWEAKPAPSASAIVGMADTWALRQGLFQEGDNSTVS